MVVVKVDGGRAGGGNNGGGVVARLEQPTKKIQEISIKIRGKSQ